MRARTEWRIPARMRFVGWVAVVSCLALGLVHCDPPVADEVAVEAPSDDAGDQADQAAIEQPAPDLPGVSEPGAEPTLPPDVPRPADSTPEPSPPDQPALPDPPAPDQAPDQAPDRSVVPDTPPAPAGDYTKIGPLGVPKVLGAKTYAMPSATGCATNCSVTIFPTVPNPGTGPQAPYPLAIISNGFQVKASFYQSYATLLASWGYVVLRWDTTDSLFSPLQHKALGEMTKELINWATSENTKATSLLKGLVDTSKVYVVGHSRGGKGNALAAQIDPRIVGIFGIDPVDSNPPGMSGVSAIANMSKTKAPLAVVGADKGGQGFQACAPAADNYAKFYDAAQTTAWELLITETGHMQFLDTQSGCLACLACTRGSRGDKEVRSITHVAMVAWAEFTIRGVNIDTYTKGAWQQQLVTNQTIKVRLK